MDLNELPPPYKTYVMTGSFIGSILMVVLQKAISFSIDTTWLINIMIITLLGVSAYFYQQRNADIKEGMKDLVSMISELKKEFDAEKEKRMEYEVECEKRFAELSSATNRQHPESVSMKQLNTALTEILNSNKQLINLMQSKTQ